MQKGGDRIQILHENKKKGRYIVQVNLVSCKYACIFFIRKKIQRQKK